MPEVEEWRPVADWPDYAVSNLGRVKRVTTYGRGKAGTIRKPNIGTAGYPVIALTHRDGRRQNKTVHSLVAEAFIGSRPNPNMEINHLDANRENPRADNLEWATRSRNRKHGYDVGFANAKGELNGYSKLTEAAVLDIRANGGNGMWLTLAVRHGVSCATIRDVYARRTWAHVTA